MRTAVSSRLQGRPNDMPGTVYNSKSPRMYVRGYRYTVLHQHVRTYLKKNARPYYTYLRYNRNQKRLILGHGVGFFQRYHTEYQPIRVDRTWYTSSSIMNLSMEPPRYDTAAYNESISLDTKRVGYMSRQVPIYPTQQPSKLQLQNSKRTGTNLII